VFLFVCELSHSGKVKQIAELNEVLKQRDTKLAEARDARADLIKNRREPDHGT
jgi:hypothetical protein